MDIMEVLKKLRKYYDENCRKLVFLNEKKLSLNNKCKMYYLDVFESVELQNYKKLFQEYLVFYIRNRDFFSICNNIKEARDSDELSKVLNEEGKTVHDNKGIYPQTDEKKSGIYGELFDDFYLNIVKQEEIMLTYSIRSSFNIPNVRGVDLVGVKVEKNNLILILSEAKFVSNITSASSALHDDIVGNNNQLGHVTKKYINDYVSFIMNKEHSIFFDEKNSEFIRNKLIELNDLLINHKLLPIDAFNKMKIKVRFDFFAIYHDNNHNIDERKNHFDIIVDQFNDSIVKTGIDNYDIEVIFIPTKNTSVDLKKEMELWD